MAWPWSLDNFTLDEAKRMLSVSNCSVSHFNARSLCKNSYDIYDFISSFVHTFSVVSSLKLASALMTGICSVRRRRKLNTVAVIQVAVVAQVYLLPQIFLTPDDKTFL